MGLEVRNGRLGAENDHFSKKDFFFKTRVGYHYGSATNLSLGLNCYRVIDHGKTYKSQIFCDPIWKP